MRSLAIRITVVLTAALSNAAMSAAQSSAQGAAQSGTPVASAPALPASDSIFRRARRLVSDGNGVQGRALVDSMLHAASEGTPAYGDALYWRGALAETAAAAERDYRQVVVEFPLSPYVDDALLSLAELEQARGDRTAALQHLQRFVREHPVSPARARAGLAAARLAFEQRDTARGCAMITDARSSVGASDVELRNQIEYYGGRCPAAAPAASAVASSVGGSPATSAPTSASAPIPVAPTTKPSVAPTRAATASTSSTTSRTPASASAKPASAATSVASKADAPVPTPEPALADDAPTPKPVAKPATAVKPTAATKSTPAAAESAPPKAAAASAPRGNWTIQLAAYNTRPDAQRLVIKLEGRGVKARISGDAKPFRVRLDFYPTHAAAAAAVAELKARGIIGFVTEETAPGGATTP